MQRPETSEFALAVEQLRAGPASFMDMVVASKASADLDRLDAALRWLVNTGHARYDCGSYHAEPALEHLRDRLPNATVIPLKRPS